MSRATVTVVVPPEAGHLAILRTAVGGFAARHQLTIDQVDDLRMAVEEAAVALLRSSGEERITMDISDVDDGVEVRLSAPVAEGTTVLEDTSWSWMILSALADDLRVERQGPAVAVVLVKHRLPGIGEARDAGERISG